MDEKKIKLLLIDKADDIAKAIRKGKDVEIRKSANGLLVLEVDKKKI